MKTTFSGAAGLALGAASAGVLTLSAWLLRHGLRAEAAYAERKIARRPGIPGKLFSSVLAGVGIALASFSGDSGLIAALLYGAVTTVRNNHCKRNPCEGSSYPDAPNCCKHSAQLLQSISRGVE